MKISVIILNWNGKELLKKFLPSIIKCSSGAEIIIADNASTDDSIQWLSQNYPRVRIIKHNTNLGYADGYNVALQQVDSDYYILLNSDVEVTPGWIDPVINFMNANSDVAVCQPKLKWYNKKDTFEYAGACGGLIDWLGYPFCRGRIFNELEIDNGQYDDLTDVFWASGACMFVKSKIFKEANGFDPVFFAHMEEIDLCWRIKNMGYRVCCVPLSTVYHMGGATLNKTSPRKTYLNFRNNLSMLYKNVPKQRLMVVILLRLVLDGIAGFKFLLEGNILDCTAVIKAHFHFYSRVITRKIVRQKNVVEFPDTVYQKSLVAQFYIHRRKKYSDLP